MEIITTANAILFFIVCLAFMVAIAFAVKFIAKKVKQEECNHFNRFTHVQKSYATCEEVTETCLDCDKTLSHKIDCI